MRKLKDKKKDNIYKKEKTKMI